MRILVSIVKRVSMENGSEQLYVNNSKLLLQVLELLRLQFLYESMLQPKVSNKLVGVREKRMQEVATTVKMYAEKGEFVGKSVNAQEVIINPFTAKHSPASKRDTTKESPSILPIYP